MSEPDPNVQPRLGPVDWVIVAVAFVAIAPLWVVPLAIGLGYKAWHRLRGRKPPPSDHPPGMALKILSATMLLVAVTVMSLGFLVEWTILLPFRIVGRKKIEAPWAAVGMSVLTVQWVRAHWNDWPTS